MEITEQEAKQAMEDAKWFHDLQRVCSRAPKDVWLFCASGNLHVMVKRNGGRAITKNGGYDKSASCGAIYGIESDGGDW